jgi:hypothetical protein
MSSLLNIDKNYKTVKGQALGFQTGILYLAPADESGVMNVCPFSSPGCRATCLYTAGHGRYGNVKAARQRRTVMYHSERENFYAQLRVEIKAAIRKAEKNKMIPVFRLNGTSDLPALALRMAQEFPTVQMYDYSKIPFSENDPRLSLPNYHVTFSRSEYNWPDCRRALALGINVAVVFDTKPGEALPEMWRGFKVIDGDENDLRFLDEKGVIVGLRAKGRAKRDRSGFVVRLKDDGAREYRGLPVIGGNI